MNRLFGSHAATVREFFERADRIAGHLNVLLVVVALGLAALDFTFFVTEKMIDSLPPITQLGADSPPQHPGVEAYQQKN